MEEESNPIKEYLFNYIEKSENRFQQLFSQTKMAEIINDILDNCYYKVTLMENKEESLGVLSTGILHYMLTNAMLTSQRKVEKKTLIICIPKTLDKKIIQKKLEKLQNIQPEKQNIWLVLTQDLGFEYKTYVIQKEKSSFSNIIFDIAQFVNVQGHNKFKILRV
jgi:hypothetical protein